MLYTKQAIYNRVCTAYNCSFGVLFLKPRAHWSVTASFCQFSDWKLLISCISGSNIGNNNNNRNFQPKQSVQLLQKIYEIRSCQPLNWQKQSNWSVRTRLNGGVKVNEAFHIGIHKMEITVACTLCWYFASNIC